jgi:hypothetical protein
MSLPRALGAASQLGSHSPNTIGVCSWCVLLNSYSHSSCRSSTPRRIVSNIFCRGILGLQKQKKGKKERQGRERGWEIAWFASAGARGVLCVDVKWSAEMPAAVQQSASARCSASLGANLPVAKASSLSNVRPARARGPQPSSGRAVSRRQDRQ